MFLSSRIFIFLLYQSQIKRVFNCIAPKKVVKVKCSQKETPTHENFNAFP